MRWLAAFFFLASLAPLPAAPEIVVATYNLQNYVAASTKGPGERFDTKAKPEEAIATLIRIIKEINPDVLGVCEMGSRERFEDFQKRLKEAGLGYRDAEYVQGADEDRHLALVSRFPIVARHSRGDVPYELNGRPEKVKRGLLDVTVQVNAGYQLRLVGVHLKSKLAAPEGEALIRRLEAEQVRKHLDGIFAEVPEANLVCYGDFNDSKNEPAIQAIMGPRKSVGAMSDLLAKDDLGDRWTHFWKVADEYSRIDFLFVSPGLAREVVPSKTRVYRSAYWNEASDHRAVFATILAEERK